MRYTRDVWPTEHELFHLVRDAQQGGPSALDALLARLRRSFVAYLEPALGWDDAQDAAQLALLSITRALPGIDAERALGYVLTVAQHRLVKAWGHQMRARRRHGPLELALGMESPFGADREADYNELDGAVQAELAKLPPERRDLLLETKTPETLAARAHVRAATIRTWRKRARARLRRRIASFL